MTDQDLKHAIRFASIIERVHGKNHPELTTVREISDKFAGAVASASCSVIKEL